MGGINENESNLNDFINQMFVKYAELLDSGIPKAYALYKESRNAFLTGDVNRAEKIKRLNYLLHNSEIPYTSNIGKNSIFSYGGIGVIIHGAAIIGERANIGPNVTIGGDRNGTPTIGDDVFLSTGCKIVGNVKIGNGAIIGANSVVRTDVSSFSIAGGIPSKIIGKITRDNFKNYSGYYWCKGDTEGESKFLNWYFPN
jgi:serine O-acetyltransferase